MTSSIELVGVCHRFGDFEALKSIDLRVEAGEFAVLLGPSGCGKTTLLMTLAGFLTPSQGRVLIGGKDVTHDPPVARSTTTVFQDYALFPHMTLEANVAFGPRMKGVGKTARHNKAMEFLELVGLANEANKKPFELSGGQRQRVALARALAVDPEVLLLDEPLGALDLNLRRHMQDELKAIQRRVGTTFIHVTHDQEEAMAIADKVILMNQGQIEDCGTGDAVYMRPASLFSAGFMGEINFLPGVIAEIDERELTINTSLGRIALPRSAASKDTQNSDRVQVCIRPEHFRTEGIANSVALGRARIDKITFSGTHRRCHLQSLGDDRLNLIVHMSQSIQCGAGDIIDIAVNADLLTVLPADQC